MTFVRVDYQLLKQHVNSSIKSLLEKSHLDSTKVDESVKQLQDPARRTQTQFLLKIIERLDADDCPAKYQVLAEEILHAAVFYVRYQIEKSYPHSNPQRSMLYSSLTTSLNITKTNIPEPRDIITMYNLLAEFLKANTYTANAQGMCNPENGYLTEQAFASIPGYKVELDIMALSKKALKLENEAIRVHIEAKEGKALSASSGASPVSTITGFFGIGVGASSSSMPTTVSNQSYS